MGMHQPLIIEDPLAALLKHEEETEKTLDRITEKFYISFFQRKLLTEEVQECINNFDKGPNDGRQRR